MQGLQSKIKEQQQAKLPFVVYCKPNEGVVNGLFQKDTILHQVVDFSEKGFVFTSFDGTEKYIIPEHFSDRMSFTFQEKTIKIPSATPFLATKQAQKKFEQLVAKGIQAIKEGTFQKVVLSRQEIIDNPNFDLNAVFERLLHNYPSALVYCFYHPKVGLWLGATPEVLIKTRGTAFETIALAGTQKITDAQPIHWKAKEKQEQELVTNYIVSQLAQYCEQIEVSSPYTIQAGTISHIRTDIKGILKKEKSLQQIISLLHPTPAVCGLPMANAKKFILENEAYNRSFYTGFLGELNIDFCSNLFVNLRCMQVVRQNIILYMGCGITSGSIPENEWEESVNKSITMKNVLKSVL